MSTHVIVVEAGKKSTTVGPYHSRERADKDLAAWVDRPGVTAAWVEPVIKPEAYDSERYAKEKPAQGVLV